MDSIWMKHLNIHQRTLWIYIDVSLLFCIICMFRYTNSSLEVRQGGSVIYWIIVTSIYICIRSIVTYLQHWYIFVVLLHVRGFVTWMCEYDAWRYMYRWVLIYRIMCWNMECIPRHMSDCIGQVGIVNVIPGESGLSWYSWGPYSGCGSYVKFLWTYGLGRCLRCH